MFRTLKKKTKEKQYDKFIQKKSRLSKYIYDLMMMRANISQRRINFDHIV